MKLTQKEWFGVFLIWLSGYVMGVSFVILLIKLYN